MLIGIREIAEMKSSATILAWARTIGPEALGGTISHDEAQTLRESREPRRS